MVVNKTSYVNEAKKLIEVFFSEKDSHWTNEEYQNCLKRHFGNVSLPNNVRSLIQNTIEDFNGDRYGLVDCFCSEKIIRQHFDPELIAVLTTLLFKFPETRCLDWIK